MQIMEMRSALKADHQRRGMGHFPNAPDWAIRRMYESRKGLPLTEAPVAAHHAAVAFWTRQKNNLSKLLRTAQPMEDAASESEREERQSRIRAMQIAFLK